MRSRGGGGGGMAQWLANLLLDPAALGSIFLAFLNFFRGFVAVNQLSCLVQVDSGLKMRLPN